MLLLCCMNRFLPAAGEPAAGGKSADYPAPGTKAAAEPAAEGESAEYPALGSKSAEVQEMKRRLQELRYIGNGSLTRIFNEKTEESLRLFQRVNGLPETGVLDEETRERLFSDSAISKPYDRLPELKASDPPAMPEMPDRDEEGYLAEGDEFFYENDEGGLWIYLGKKLQITITRRVDSSVPLIWFETDIKTREGEGFRTVMTDPDHPGKKFQYPHVIAKNNNFVLGFSDDFYATRMADKETVGIIIRDGQIISRNTNSKRGHHLPNLDMMAQYPDGRMAVFDCNEKSPEEMIEEGAVQVYSFGPWLLRDGEINEMVYTWYRSIEPRHALGMIEPGHYFLLSVQGRTNDSKGTFLQRVAEMMQDRGVKEALNLDGGNTMALVFRGRMLNKLAVYKNRKFVRTVTSLIGIGYTENQAE